MKFWRGRSYGYSSPVFDRIDMEKITKTYYLNGKSAGKLYTCYCGVEITLNFKTSVSATGSECAVLITSEPFVQDAIEADSRFGGAIRLGRVYRNVIDAENELQVRPKVAPAAARQKEKDDEDEAKRVAMREKRKKAAAKKQGGGSQVVKGSVDAQPSTAEEGDGGEKLVFGNVNEAMRYFLELGVDVNEENMAALLEQYNAEIAG